MSDGVDGNVPGLTPAEIERLALLAEECAEVIQAVGKVLRHGYASEHPFRDGPDNRRALQAEIGHVLAAVCLMTREGDVDGAMVEIATRQKKMSVVPWLHHQPPAAQP